MFLQKIKTQHLIKTCCVFLCLAITACGNQLAFKGPPVSTQETHIRVSLATQVLTAYKNGVPVFTMPVIIGREGRDTPQFTDAIVNLKFNPDWTPPKSLVGELILPRFLRDKNYTQGFWAIKGGKRIEASSINWNKSNIWQYTLVQKPGPQSALGLVRFSLTNPWNIYLHDTPYKGFFSQTNRRLSAGCIRVADAKKLAQWILAEDGQPWGIHNINSVENLRTPLIVRLKRPMKVIVQ